MTKKSILAVILLFASISLTQKTIAQENPFFNYKGKLIIVGGGNMPDSLFTFLPITVVAKINQSYIYQQLQQMSSI